MKPLDAIPVFLSPENELAARVAMIEMLGADWKDKRGAASWAGFAAEHALREAWAVPSTVLEEARTLDHDLLLSTKSRGYKIEVKTRAVEAGWTDPRRFDYVIVPSHDGREPIKAVDLVWFAWYSGSRHRTLWALGYCRGPEEFYRRATYYRENEPLPRGGYARKGGAYAIEVKHLRPFPRHSFEEFIQS